MNTTSPPIAIALFAALTVTSTRLTPGCWRWSKAARARAQGLIDASGGVKKEARQAIFQA